MSSVGARVRQARALARMTQTALAKESGVSQGTIAKYERGTLVPEGGTLEAIAASTGMPVGFFHDRRALESAGASTIRFREHSRMAARDRDRAQVLGDLAYELTRSLGEGLRLPRVVLPDGSYGHDVARAAADTRIALGFTPDEPIGHLSRAAERAGVRLFQVPADAPAPTAKAQNVQAFSYWAGTELDDPVVVLYRGHAGDRLRWSLAHELGHLVLHLRLVDEARAEPEAHAFAAEFLLPAEPFLSDLGSTISLAGLVEMKRVWRVSIAAMVQRAYGLGAISEQRRKSLFVQLARHGWRTREPAAVPPERPRLLRQLAEKASGTPPDLAALARREQLPLALVAMLVNEQDAGADTQQTEASITSLTERRAAR